MQSAWYYREQAAHALQLSTAVVPLDIVEMLERLARDYSDIANDLENGAVEIVHPERMPQLDHPG